MKGRERKIEDIGRIKVNKQNMTLCLYLRNDLGYFIAAV